MSAIGQCLTDTGIDRPDEILGGVRPLKFRKIKMAIILTLITAILAATVIVLGALRLGIYVKSKNEGNS
jgi:hypothetical protein